MKTACQKNVMTQVVRRDRRLGSVGQSGKALMDTVARLQLDMEELRAGFRSRWTPPLDIWTSQGPPRQVASLHVD